MNFDDGKLIELVRPYTFIYDKKEVLFKNKEARRNAWNSIGLDIQRKGNECEQRWNVLRTRYNTERRELNKPSGSAGGLKKKWPLFDAFGFIDPHLVQKKTKGNISVGVSEENDSLSLDFIGLVEAVDELAMEQISEVATEEYFSPTASTSFNTQHQCSKE